MKKTYSFMQIISVLLIFAIFSCNLPGDNKEAGTQSDGTASTGGVTKVFELLASYTVDSVKRLLDTKNSGGGGSEKYASKTKSDDYNNTDSSLRFDYDKGNESIIVSDVYKKSDSPLTAVKILTIAKDEIDKFIDAITSQDTNGKTFTAEIHKTGDGTNGVNGIDKDAKNAAGQNKCITVYGKGGNCFFDLDEQQAKKPKNDKVPSYMIPKTEGEKIKKWCENIKTKLSSKA